MDLMQLARDERTDLAHFLATLTPEQWDAPSLCARWRVRDVVTHMPATTSSTPPVCSAGSSKAGSGPTAPTPSGSPSSSQYSTRDAKAY